MGIAAASCGIIPLRARAKHFEAAGAHEETAATFYCFQSTSFALVDIARISDILAIRWRVQGRGVSCQVQHSCRPGKHTALSVISRQDTGMLEL